MYDRLIDGKTSLTISVNYKNANEESLMGIIKTSKLTQRH